MGILSSHRFVAADQLEKEIINTGAASWSRWLQTSLHLQR